MLEDIQSLLQELSSMLPQSSSETPYGFYLQWVSTYVCVHWCTVLLRLVFRCARISGAQPKLPGPVLSEHHARRKDIPPWSVHLFPHIR